MTIEEIIAYHEKQAALWRSAADRMADHYGQCASKVIEGRMNCAKFHAAASEHLRAEHPDTARLATFTKLSISIPTLTIEQSALLDAATPEEPPSTLEDMRAFFDRVKEIIQ